MNCCNEYGDCRQGRDCPVRKAATCPHCHGLGYDASGYSCTCASPARVARIGRKDYAQEPLPPLPWRRQLRHLARWMLTGILGLMLWAGILVALIHA